MLSILDRKPRGGIYITPGQPAPGQPAQPAPAAPVKQNWPRPKTVYTGTTHKMPEEKNPQPDRLGPSPLQSGVTEGIKPLPEVGKTVGLIPTNLSGSSPVPMDEYPKPYVPGDGILGTAKADALNNNTAIIKQK
jgi:hypothetical protein